MEGSRRHQFLVPIGAAIAVNRTARLKAGAQIKGVGTGRSGQVFKAGIDNARSVDRGCSGTGLDKIGRAGRAECIGAAVGLYIGDIDRIKKRWRAQWEDMPYTGVTVRTEQEEAYELMAELVGAGDA